MKPASTTIVALLSFFLAVWAASALYGQSLADLARQQRARKGQETRSGKLFTNDDIRAATLASPAPAEPSAAAPPQAGQQTPPAAGAAGAAPAPGSAGAAPAAGEPQQTEAALEKEYREKFAKLREDQDLAERKLDVMQRELNLMQTQHYSDPNQALREQTFRTEINQRTADMETQKASIEKAKQAIADLEEELRRKNLPPGWAR